MVFAQFRVERPARERARVRQASGDMYKTLVGRKFEVAHHKTPTDAVLNCGFADTVRL